DGEKMSKSKGNTIPLFAPAKTLRKTIMKIVTGSEPLEAPAEAEGSTVFELYRLLASEAEQEAMKERLRGSEYGWGHAKQALYEALEAELGPRREVYDALRADEAKLDALLEEGADRVRPIARATIDRVRRAVGMRV
ncbi:MAG: tryptophan--tRNA ligase, partial [Myxococcales bacterium]|nr:tryptophan--tRNA ligase [Myxococcales bacterium]